MVFDTISPTSSTHVSKLSTNRVLAFDHMFTSTDSSTIELPLSDERDLYQIEATNKQQSQPSKWKMMSKRRQSCSSDMYATASRYHRFKPLPPPPSSSSTLNQFSSSDETLSTQPTLFSSFNKFSHDDMKFYSNSSAHITTRRSTTDCNNISTNIIRRPSEQTNQNLLTIVDEESRDSIWPSSDSQSNRSLSIFYSQSSITPSSSISSFNSRLNSTDLHSSFYQNTPQTPKTCSSSSSSGYESTIPTTDSSLNSIPDHLLFSSPDSIIMPPPSKIPSLEHPPTNTDRNLVEQFIDLHLQKQTSFDHDVNYSPPSSFSSTSSSFLSQTPISTINSPLCCRKCVNNNTKNDNEHNQLSSDTEDDSQSTTITVNLLPLQQQQSQNKRPRSLPIAIQQPKGINIDHHHQTNGDNDDDDDDDDDASDDSLQNSLTCHCSKNSSRKKRFRTCEFHQPTNFNAATSFISTTTDKLHIDFKDLDEQNLSEQTTTIKTQKNSLEHFIMSPTDKVKVQMKYPSNNNDKESEMKSNELKISQPEDIDFKRSKQKAIRVLYQNRLNLNSIQSPVARQNSVILPSKTAVNHCDSPLAKRTINPRLLRSVLSCSVIEADDEHEVVSSSIVAKQSGVNGTREKSPIETFNCLRSNFTESLLHGKILPCGILDGFTVKLGASGLFMPKQVVLPVTTFWFNVSEHQAASPYLGFINLQCLPKRGYHTPTKGTITLALLNPNGTAVHLFLILYDFSDMPPDHRTFIRQRIVLMPEDTSDRTKPNQPSTSKGNLRYLAHIRFVTSQTGKLYMHSDIRLIFARNKLDYDDRTAAGGKAQLVTLTDTPTPKYWSRK